MIEINIMYIFEDKEHLILFIEDALKKFNICNIGNWNNLNKFNISKHYFVLRQGNDAIYLKMGSHDMHYNKTDFKLYNPNTNPLLIEME